MSSDGNRGQYEFSEEQGRVIADLSSGVRLVGILLFLFGAFYLVGLILTVVKLGWTPHFTGPGVLIIVSALIYLSFGWWFQKSSAAFDDVVTTQGRDIDNLMVALDELRKPFALIRTLIMLYAVLVLIGLVAMLITAFAHRPA